MNPHKIIQVALLISVVVPSLVHGWEYVRWRLSAPPPAPPQKGGEM